MTFNALRDKERNLQKQRVMKVRNKWFRALGLGWWRVDYKWVDWIEPKHEGNTVLARCDVDWPYKEATITISLLQVKELDDERLEYALLHEYMHIFVNEMRDDKEGIDHEERVCTDLAQAFIWAVKNVRSK